MKAKETASFSRFRHTFTAFFTLEISRLFCKRNLRIAAVILLLLGIFIQDGVNVHKKTLDKIKPFQETEQLKVEQYVLITQYGAYGIRMMQVPAPFSILFTNSGVYDQLESNVDVGERLNIYTSFKDQRIFSEPGGFMDFCGLLLLCGSILGLLYGYDRFRHTEALKFLSGLGNPRAIFYSAVVTRVVLFNLFLIFLASLSLLVGLANGFNLYGPTFLSYLYVLCPVTTFFVVVGCAAGNAKKKSNGLMFLLGFFFVSIFLVPWGINKIARINADSLVSNYKTEMEKLKFIMNFEAKFLKEIGVFKSGEEAPEEVKKLIQSYIDNEYKKIVKIEAAAKKRLTEKIDDFQLIATLFPTTFYFSTGYEISSRGYDSLIDFYSYNQKIKEGFFKKYIFRKYYKPTKELESYIQGDENLFYAKSGTAGNFLYGQLITLIYILIALGMGDKMYYRALYPKTVKKDAFNDIHIPLQKGKIITIETTCTPFIDEIGNVLDGKTKDFTGKISLDGQDITPNEKYSTVNLCNHAAFPPCIPVNKLVTFFKYTLGLTPEQANTLAPRTIHDSGKPLMYKDLGNFEKARLLLRAAMFSNARVFIFHDFFAGLPSGNFSDLAGMMKELTGRGAVIIDVVRGNGVISNPDYHATIHFDGNGYLARVLKDYHRQDY